MSVCVALTLVLSIFVFRRVPRTSLLPLALFFICRPLDRTFSFTTFKLMKIYECEIHFTDFLAVEIIFFFFHLFLLPISALVFVFDFHFYRHGGGLCGHRHRSNSLWYLNFFSASSYLFSLTIVVCMCKCVHLAFRSDVRSTSVSKLNFQLGY